MNTIKYLIPISFISSLIAGLIGITNTATLFLGAGLALVFGYLITNTIVTYILIEDNDDDICEYTNNTSAPIYKKVS